MCGETAVVMVIFSSEASRTCVFPNITLRTCAHFVEMT
jgi:hypothetical protein